MASYVVEMTDFAFLPISGYQVKLPGEIKAPTGKRYEGAVLNHQGERKVDCVKLSDE
jgi:hypothetical protein